LRRGSAAELEAVIDTELINDLVNNNITYIYDEEAERYDITDEVVTP